MLKRMKEYASEFIHDESGMEFLQLAVVILFVVGLIGVVMVLQQVISKNIGDATSQADTSFQNMMNGGADAGGSGGTSGGTSGGGP